MLSVIRGSIRFASNNRVFCASSRSMTTPLAKKARTMPIIVTHSGSFHADEALAVHMLRILPEYQDAEIIRSRDPAVWSKATVLVDVGAEYDPSKHKYDHHQKEFNDTFSEKYKTRLSSAGLVYKHFGHGILAQLLQWEENDSRLEQVYQRLYRDLIETFDGVDNGVERYPTSIRPAYRDNTGLAGVVARLHPNWNEEQSSSIMDEAFLVASRTVGDHFNRFARYIGLAWLPARSIVYDAITCRFNGPLSEMFKGELTPDTARARGHLVVMDQFCPWKEHLMDVERELVAQGDPSGTSVEDLPKALKEGEAVPVGLALYVVFPDSSQGWRVQAIPLRPYGFENRKSLPAAWCGLRDEALDAASGVQGGVFVHVSGFIGGHATKEGAIRLAELAAAM